MGVAGGKNAGEGVGRRKLFAGAAAGLAGASVFTGAAPAAAETVSLDWFNVTDAAYGAVGDGKTDDTVAIQTAIDAANSGVNSAVNSTTSVGGGVVYFPRGTYLVTPSGTPAVGLSLMGTGLQGYQGVRLVGAGEYASTIKKNGAGTLLQLSGPSSDPLDGSTHCRYCSVESLGFDGNNLAGLIFQCYYADNILMRDVYVNANADIVLDTAEFWDSRFTNVVCGGSGSTTAGAQTPNFWIRDSAAAAGFGNSTDTVNQIYFHGCRWEAFTTGAVWVGQGLGNIAGPNDIFFTDCKMETSALNGGPHLSVDANSRAVHVKHLYAYSGGFTDDDSTAQDMITCSAQFGTLDDVLLSNGGSATVANGITLNSPSAGNVVVAENITATWKTAPTGATVGFGTATGGFKVSNVTANLGTVFGGTIPNAPAAANSVQTFTASGTWTKPPGAGLVTAILIAGGGGGGSGAVEASGTLATGGAGGGGGAYSLVTLPASVLNSTETVTVGTGGAGGAAVGTAAAHGNAGGNGSNSVFKNASFAVANWGDGGAGGTSTGAATGGASGPGSWAGSTGASSSATGGAGSTSAGTQQGATGGGAGGGVTTSAAAAAGGSAGNVSASGGIPGGAAGTSGGGAGRAGGSAGPLVPIAGTGGGGGGASSSGTAGAGGAGGDYGAGGGGGGAAVTGHGSGAGGAGAPGIVVVIASTAT